MWRLCVQTHVCKCPAYTSMKQACSEGITEGKLLANAKDEAHQAEKYLLKNVKQGHILFYIKDASFLWMLITQIYHFFMMFSVIILWIFSFFHFKISFFISPFSIPGDQPPLTLCSPPSFPFQIHS